jgi:predicted DNA-binding transcriptional regulator AlpA
MSTRSCGFGKDGAAFIDDLGDDQPLDSAASAKFIGVGVVTFWRQVAAGLMPRPFYAAPRAPRWRKRELREACERQRRLPSEAKAGRRVARLAKEATDAV